MKKHLVIYIVLMMVCCYSRAQTISNGGFEGGNATRWDISGNPGYTSLVVPNTIGNGKYALKLQNIKGGKYAMFSQKIGLKPAGYLKKAVFSASVKTDSVSPGFATLHIRVFDDKGIQLSYVNNSSYGLKGSNDWKKITVELPVSGLASRIELGGMLMGGGTAYFDDLKLSISKATAVARSAKAKAYLDSALDLIAQHSLKKDSVDFDYLKKVAYSVSEGAQSHADCYFAIKTVLKGLDDHHSFFQSPQEAKQLTGADAPVEEWPTGKVIGKTTGYIKVPAFELINDKVEKAWADSLQQLIGQVDNKDITGWVVDLRGNLGGNVFPMMAGVGPILGDGVAGYSVRANGSRDSSGYSKGSVFGNNGASILKVSSPYTLLKPGAKVAVLIDGNTASSGEALTIAFNGRPATKTFGEPTYGLTTGNEDFTLSDGAMMFVASVVGQDRTGKKYGGKITPDVVVIDDKATKTDEVLDAALAWLTSAK